MNTITRKREVRTYAPFTEEEILDIVSLFNLGKPAKSIATKYERTVGSINQVIYNYTHKKEKSFAGKVALKVNGVTVANVPSENMEHKINEEQITEAINNAEFVSTETTPSPVVEKTKTMTPREMIKYLYNQGYRIENNQLVCYVRTPVNVKDIIKEQ